MKDYVNSAALQEYTTKLVAKLKTLFPGTPTAAATVAEMTDHNKTYVYVGTESGYTAGDWYYWNGTAWTSGGPFQATSIITDTTLAVAGEAADAKATGDAIAAAKTAVLNAMAPAYSPSGTYAVGVYVNHNGAIYRCTTAITTAEAWTAGHWTEVPLGTDLADQVGALKESLNDDLFADRYVKYNSLTTFSFASTSARPNFSRYGNTFTLDGSVNAGSDRFGCAKLSEEGSTNWTVSVNTARTWTKSIKFLDGHIYRCKLTQMSGIASIENLRMVVYIYADDEHEYIINIGEDTIICPGNIEAVIFVSMQDGCTFSNAKYAFTIEDVTESGLQTNAKYIVGGINENLALIKKSFTGDYNQLITIPVNSDFDNYTNVGNYRVATDTTAATIANMPLQRRGRLFVIDIYNEDRKLQLFVAGAGIVGAVYKRYYANSHWSAWMYFATEADITRVDSDIATLQNKTVSTKGLAYSWWVNNRVVDSYGTLYFGYISENAMCGVGCRFADGTVYKKDLFASANKDDHNAPSVILLTIDGEERVCVIGSTGHNTDSKINCYVATEPNTVLCDFDDRTYTINAPTGYTYQCSYSQAYYDENRNRIYNFFRLKQINNSNSEYYMIWMCAISADYGETWSIYRAFATGEKSELFYMWSCDVDNNKYMKRVVLQTNTTNTGMRSIRQGIVDCYNLDIYSGSGFSADNINKPMTLMADGELAYDPNVTIANYNDFAEVIHANDGEYYRYRILDVWPGNRLQLHFLFAKSVENVQDHHDITDWILYRYSNTDYRNHPNDGVVTEIAHLGLPFFVGSSYVTGACYINNIDDIIYSKTDFALKDGPHSLHRVKLDNNTIVSDDIKKASSQTLARPARYDWGSIMLLEGKYREGEGTAYLTWHFGIGFIDSF